MKKGLSGLDIKALIGEIPTGYIKKFGTTGKNAFVMKCSRNVNIRLEGWMYASDREVEAKKIESLRYLENRRIREIRQHGSDRIITFDLGDAAIIVELFGGGNLIVTRNNVIEFAAKERIFSDRSVKVGETYQPPPESVNFFDIGFEDFTRMIGEGKYDVVRALAVDLGLGGEYAEELCARAAIDKGKKATDVMNEEAERLYSALQTIMKHDGRGYVYHQDGTAISVMPFESVLYDKGEEHASFSEAIESYVELLKKKPEKKGDEIRKAEVELKLTEALIEDAYSRYGEIYEALAGGVEFRLGDLSFDPSKSVEQNLQVLYERRKALKEKMEGLRKASDREERTRKEGKRETRSAGEWYERFWWFFTSDGFLVIAGRDANDNERIVRRYLTEEDIYVHADIHGGSSGVIKTYGREPSEDALREACHFVACFSKAWGSMSSCDAYWVRPDQVSKRPPSGQFLAKGSFMIYGKKNYYRNMPMRLSVGLVDLGGERAMCAPESAIAGRCDKHVNIVPGDKSVERAARDIAGMLGGDESEIARVLPTRGVEIEDHK